MSEIITIADFIARTDGYFDRANRFKVIVTPPPALNIPSDIQELMTYSIYSADTPPSVLGVMGNVWITGRQVKLKGDRTFGDLEANAYSDGNLSLWKTFNTWQNIMDSNANIKTSDKIKTPTDYMGTLMLIKYDDWGKVTAELTYPHVWPTSVGGISGDWSSQDSISTFPITWAINYIEDESITAENM